VSKFLKIRSEEDIQKLVKDGRGAGKLATYKPWIYSTDFASKGRVRSMYSHRFGRPHELLSDGERNVFRMLEWSPRVTDVREQYPLPRSITRKAAADLGIKHPTYPGTHIDYILTVDFCVDGERNVFRMLEWSSRVTDVREQYPLPRSITRKAAADLGIKHPTYPGTHIDYILTVDFCVDEVRDGNDFQQMIDVKTEDDLQDPDKVARLEIARLSCFMLGINHNVLFSEDVPKQKVKNLMWIRDALLDPDQPDEPYTGYFEQHMARMAQNIHDFRFDGPANDYCTAYEQRNGMNSGDGLRVMRMLLWERTLTMDLNNPSPERAHMSTFHLSARPGNLRSIGAA